MANSTAGHAQWESRRGAPRSWQDSASRPHVRRPDLQRCSTPGCAPPPQCPEAHPWCSPGARSPGPRFPSPAAAPVPAAAHSQRPPSTPIRRARSTHPQLDLGPLTEPLLTGVGRAQRRGIQARALLDRHALVTHHLVKSGAGLQVSLAARCLCPGCQAHQPVAGQASPPPAWDPRGGREAQDPAAGARAGGCRISVSARRAEPRGACSVPLLGPTVRAGSPHPRPAPPAHSGHCPHRTPHPTPLLGASPPGGPSSTRIRCSSTRPEDGLRASDRGTLHGPPQPHPTKQPARGSAPTHLLPCTHSWQPRPRPPSGHSPRGP